MSAPAQARAKRSPRLALCFHVPAKTLRQALLAWYRPHARGLPWRTLWAEKADPYTVWVSEIMLQQTVIKAVLPVYARFLTRFPNLAALAAASDDEVRQAVRGLGYYRRFRFLHQAAQQLTAQGGIWPTTFAGWKELPGIGDYTAAAISSIAFAAPAAVVDGNVERVFCRLLDRRQPPNQPELKKAFQTLAEELLDRDRPGDSNQALMELGQTVCTPTTPSCPSCPLQHGCLAFARGSQALAPAPKLRATKPRDVAMTLSIVTCRGRVALLQRPEGARFLAGTYGFFTTSDLTAGSDGWPEATGTAMAGLGQDVASVRHSITHHRIVAKVRLLELPPQQAASLLPQATRWLAPEQVEEQLVANLDRKAWHAYSARKPPLEALFKA